MLMRAMTITHDNNDDHEYLDRNNNYNTCGYDATGNNENDMIINMKMPTITIAMAITAITTILKNYKKKIK